MNDVQLTVYVVVSVLPFEDDKERCLNKMAKYNFHPKSLSSDRMTLLQPPVHMVGQYFKSMNLEFI
jgi:hypothetical protein